ncbi:anthranilate phosphoribosyltransferase [Frankia sp. CcI156]|uniref:Anthranilate phosphoribosyltransferase n=1 Tax=Frankia casuarinae (strain DSM 45818 / CECT 9043 / HFP020203 / CcI3) TaxID=106370 RepID=Q2J8C1_FRACC|nr:MULTISPECIES: anthranilate phosphoribosyltransferase [Frankia]ABD12471.1 anthranilate phosphoribosyltransferase [Frankia casuarinae]ETA01444.1 anthranilate phosphoribosyltransferase [Frankia sp. CcI6]EYT91950.1 anthranilate phosphoribosyltransferase [Frankia casuarinae]KDA44707.1 anthranilate phosphoribosyltransferase [Frankia sp. BMG5.23]OAA22912.1 anthranilate phosphoribosyltransferase [Frankia casuarinae]
MTTVGASHSHTGRSPAGASPAGALPTAGTSWPELIGALLAGESLDSARTAWAMQQIMAGVASPAQVAGFAVALRSKGETPEEIAGLVEAMLASATPLSLSERVRARAVDTCGTGGDRSHTVNLSTMAALVVAGAGVPVVKHGNRAASSSCGSADLLAELGVVVDLSPSGVEACLATAGIAFCFAQVFHPAMRHVGGVRREIGVPTAFNILGPLSNPARPGAQAIGVADARLAPVVAGVLADRGTRALVFRGDDGLDELTPVTTSAVWVVAAGAGQPRRERFDPRDVGIHVADHAALRGADARYNAAVTRSVLAGEPGPVRDAVLLAAATALVAAAGPSDAPVTEQIAAALPRAAEAVDSGAARAVLERWVTASQSAAAVDAAAATAL